MSEPVTLDRISQGGNDVILAKNVCKCPRAVFSGKDLVTHAANLGAEEKLSILICRSFFRAKIEGIEVEIFLSLGYGAVAIVSHQ